MRSTHRSGRTLPAASFAALLLLFALVAALAGTAPADASSVGAARHETLSVGRLTAVAADTNAVVRFRQDYTLPQGQTVSGVVVIRGNAFIAGTVLRSVVVIGGNATIGSTAVVGPRLDSQASSVVVVDGHLTIEPGATIRGKTVRVAGLPFGAIARGAASTAIARPVGVLTGWWQLLFLPIVALVVSALFPHTLRRVGDRVRLRFWPSLGWGLLGLFLTGILLVVLTITIVGLIIVVPAVIVLLAMLPFCLAAVAALLGRLALSSSERYRDNAVVTAVAGAVLVSLAALVPVVGGLAVFVTTAAGFGAALFLADEWRRDQNKSPSPASGEPQPPAGWPQPPAGWPQAPAGWPQAPAGWPQAPAGWPQAQAAPLSPPQPPPGWAGPQGWTVPQGPPPPGWMGAQAWGPQSWGPPPDAPQPGWGAPPDAPPATDQSEAPGPPRATAQSEAAGPPAATPPPPASDEPGDLRP